MIKLEISLLCVDTCNMNFNMKYQILYLVLRFLNVQIRVPESFEFPYCSCVLDSSDSTNPSLHVSQTPAHSHIQHAHIINALHMKSAQKIRVLSLVHPIHISRVKQTAHLWTFMGLHSLLSVARYKNIYFALSGYTESWCCRYGRPFIRWRSLRHPWVPHHQGKPTLHRWNIILIFIMILTIAVSLDFRYLEQTKTPPRTTVVCGWPSHTLGILLCS